MCRAAGGPGGPHGRRCPGSSHKQDAALQRRRENRAIGQQIACWAKEAGKAEELAELKAQRKPINEIKEWAEQAGAAESVYARAAGPARRGWDARAVAAAAAPSAEVGPAPAAAAAKAPTSPRIPALAQRKVAVPVGRNARVVFAGGGAPAGGRGAPAAVPTTGPAAPAAGRDRGEQDLRSRYGEDGERMCLLRARQGKDPQEAQLLNTADARVDRGMRKSGINEVQRLRYADGTVGYFKPYDGADGFTARMGYGHETKTLQSTHEVAASQFAQALGPRYGALVPPAVIAQHEGRWGSISYGVPGQPARGVDRLMMLNNHQQQASDLAFFDCLIGQVDRHGGNVLVDRRGISAIDQGFAFSDGVGGVNASLFVTTRAQKKEDRRLTAEERTTLRRFLDSDDGLGLKGTIEDGRFHEVRRRANLMLRKGEILDLDRLYPDR
ncbi:hypothetical protein [Kocuria palustris]|uniref:hypothetical protein n=1 Tax=Kocuria palustris TaxID=71999 RepID=UPI0033328F52